MKESTRKDAQKSTKEAMERREKTEKGGRDQLLPSDNYVPTAYTPFFGPSLSISLDSRSKHRYGIPAPPRCKAFTRKPLSCSNVGHSAAHTTIYRQSSSPSPSWSSHQPSCTDGVRHFISNSTANKSSLPTFFFVFVDLIYYSISRRRTTQDPEGCYRLSNST